MTIRNKLISMAAVVLAAIAAMAAVTLYRGNSVVTGLVNDAGLEIVESAARNIDASLDKIEAVTKSAAESVRNLMLRFAVSEEDVGIIVTALTEGIKGEGILDVYMGHEASGHFSDGSGWIPTADFDCKSRPWYKDARAAGRDKVVLTQPYIDAITRKMIITAAMAVYDDSGKLLGVVGTDFEIDGLIKYVDELSIFGKGEGLLLLESGLVMAGHRKDDILKANLTSDERYPEGLRRIAKTMVAGKKGYDSYTLEDIEKQMFFAPTRHGLALGILFPIMEIKAMVRALTIILLAISSVALIATGIVIFGIARGLNRSVRSMEAATLRLGEGDLTARYDDSGRDEIAGISRVLNGMAASMREVMASIRKEAGETARYAQTLASLSEETLSSMEEVSSSIIRVEEMMVHSASALQETNASIDEIAGGAQSAARASAEGAENAAAASDSARESLAEVGSAIGQIKSASEQSTGAIAKIRALAGSVKEISGFVATITTIADQTNLLALNAAIEAARAGEAGRGFAVVAEEVRKLAEDSARAAGEVNKLIRELQSHSGESISATEETGAILAKTIKGAEATRLKLAEAVNSMGRLAEAVQSIAAVSQEQAASSQEMTSAVQSVTDATGQAAESVKSIQAASGETTKAAEVIAVEAQKMAASSEALGSLVARFVIDEGPGGLVPVKK